MNNSIDISLFDYPLPSDRIAKFPLEERSASKLLIYKSANITESTFNNISDFLPQNSLLVFNDTKVVRARLIFHKQSGARIEIFCLEPHNPADYERAFSVVGKCSWHCIVGNSKKWKNDTSLQLTFEGGTITASRDDRSDIVNFEWNSEHTFGQILEAIGRIPIPPYLERDSEQIDNTRYQTVYSNTEGSVAAPTAGLHFTQDMIQALPSQGHSTARVTLHVGAGTFLPVKAKDARDHQMHIEVFDVKLSELEKIAHHSAKIITVGTTSTRTLESLATLGLRIHKHGSPMIDQPIGQWEAYELASIEDSNPMLTLYNWCKSNNISRILGSTQIMITPGYRFRCVDGIITNFHQPQSTLLLLISALIGDNWHKVYDYALDNEFRFLSYGDSSLLMPE